jgi:hypothetical protein
VVLFVGEKLSGSRAVSVIAKKLSVQAILGRAGFFDRFEVRFDHSMSPPNVEITKIDLIN